MMLLLVSSAAALFLSSPALPNAGCNAPRYFGQAALKVPAGTTPRPHDPISVDEAARREVAGGPAYYAACFDDHDRVVWIEKRFGGKRFFCMTYAYTSDNARAHHTTCSDPE